MDCHGATVSWAHKITKISSFPGLPKDIRQQVLREAGFHRVCPIQISRERTRLSRQRTGDFVDCWRLWRCSAEPENLKGNHRRSGHLSPICWHAALPVQLLRVCRQFYEDGIPILYGENTFIVECSGYPAASCTKLHMRPKSALRKLQILFGNPSSSDIFIQGQSEDRNIGLREVGESPDCRRAMSNGEKELFERALQQLKGLCAGIAARIMPGQLDLEVAFRVCSVEDAFTILESLEILPALSYISFCAGFWDWVHWDVPDCQIQRLLAGEARKLLHSRPLPRFPFTRLPTEIQRIILRYTVVKKSPILYTTFASMRRRIVPFPYRGRSRMISRYECCGKCRRYSSWDVCRCSHGPFYSSSCVCSIVDDGIFLVNKDIRHDALAIFYTANELLFHSDNWTVLNDLCYLLGRKSWIWCTSKLFIEVCVPSIGKAFPFKLLEPWPAFLYLLSKWKERDSRRPVVICLSNFTCVTPRCSLTKLMNFYAAVEESGFDPANVWVPEHKHQRYANRPVGYFEDENPEFEGNGNYELDVQHGSETEGLIPITGNIDSFASKNHPGYFEFLQHRERYP